MTNEVQDKTQNLNKEIEVVTSYTPVLPQGKHTGNTARASWPISLHNLRSNIRHCRPSAKQALVDSFLWCIQNDIPKADFAKEIGTSDNTVYKWITGRYTHPESGERLDISVRHENAMLRWLSEQKAQATKRSEFVLTPTAQKVITACKLAAESQTPVFLFGPSHIGKTWALEYFAETNNHGRTVYIRLGSAAGLTAMLTEIAKRLGISPTANRAKLLQRIQTALTSDMILLFDEVHLLMHTYRKESFFACIEVLREIHDRVGCGMVLSLTNLGRDKIETEKRRELQQLFRRGVHRVQLGNMPQRQDLRLILAMHGLEFPEKTDRVIVSGIADQPYEILRQLAKEDGLKSITERIRYAHKFAKHANRELTWEDFVRAHLTIQKNATPDNDWT